MTHSTSGKKTVLNEAVRLSNSPDIASYIMFAGGTAQDGAKTSRGWPDEVRPVAIEQAFEHVLNQSPSFIETML